MFVVLLRFAGNRDRAGQFMDGHKAWLKRGFDEGLFLMAGSLQPDGGGGIVAHGISRAGLKALVDQDPFVSAGVVRAEIVEIAPARADQRLAFLMDMAA